MAPEVLVRLPDGDAKLGGHALRRLACRKTGERSAVARLVDHPPDTKRLRLHEIQRDTAQGQAKVEVSVGALPERAHLNQSFQLGTQLAGFVELDGAARGQALQRRHTLVSATQGETPQRDLGLAEIGACQRAEEGLGDLEHVERGPRRLIGRVPHGGERFRDLDRPAVVQLSPRPARQRNERVNQRGGLEIPRGMGCHPWLGNLHREGWCGMEVAMGGRARSEGEGLHRVQDSS